MTTKLIADWLATTVAADLTVTTVKGSSAYARPATGTGNAYIEWRDTEPVAPTRVGQTVTRWTTRFQIVITTGNEIDLWAIVDSIKTMTQARTEATIGGARHRVAWTAASRAEPSEETIEALRYAAVTQVSITE